MSLSTAFPSATPALNLNFVRNNRLDPRLTYSRASTATYVGSDGYIKTAAINEPRFEYDPVSLAPRGLLHEGPRTNLLTYSEQFDNATGWSVTTGAPTTLANSIISPDGNLSADKIVEDTTTGLHARSRPYSFISGTTYTYSVYVKAGERTLVRIEGGNSVTWSARTVFDLSSGTIVTTTFGTATVQSVGNGWYRCTITGLAGATASTNINHLMIDSGVNTSYTGDGTSGIYLWGAQLEEAFFESSYIPTTSASATRAEDEMSIKDTPIVNDRTNIQTYSNQFDLWPAQGVSIEQNVIASPDRITRGSRMIASSGTTSHRVYSPAVSITSGEATTLSIHAKYIDRKYIRVGLFEDGGSYGFHAIFDISNGTVQSTTSGANATYISSSITPAGDGWYRLKVTGTIVGFTNHLAYINMYDDSVNRLWTFDNTSVYLWGAQIEAGQSATSYIPTGASAVTIPAPTRTISDNKFSSWYNQANGAFVISSDTFKADNTANTTYSRILNLTDGTAGGRYTLYYNTVGGISMIAPDAGFTTSDSNSGVASKTVQKIGVNIQAGNSFLTHNGVQAGTTETAAIVMNYMDRLEFFKYGTSSDEVNYGWGHMQYLLYYAEPLTLAQLRTLTK